MMLRTTHLSLYVAHTPPEAAEQAATIMAEQCERAINNRGVFNLAISGGSTPIPLFRLLATSAWQKRIAWDKTTVYWVDERCVHPDNATSNYRVAREELLSHVNATRFYRMKGEDDPVKAAQAYEDLLRDHFCLLPDEYPRFDYVLLGVGEDGHTGSLFPDAPALKTQNKLVVDHYIHETKASRLTMTIPVLNNARCCVFLATGKSKHHVLSTALNLMEEPVLPAQMIRPTHGKLCWIIDKEAYILDDDA